MGLVLNHTMPRRISPRVQRLFQQYAAARHQSGGRKIGIGQFQLIVTAPKNESLRAIGKRAHTTRATARNVLVTTRLRNKDRIQGIGIAANTRLRSVETMANGTVLQFIQDQLAHTDKTMRQIAIKAGVNPSSVKKINKKEKIRKNPRSVGGKIAAKQRLEPKWDAIRALLQQKTPEGNFRFTQNEVISRLARQGIRTNHVVVGRIARHVRSEQERNEMRGHAVSPSNRRRAFLEKALRFTRSPIARITQRAITRETRQGRPATQTAIRNAIVNVKRERGLKGMRFQESKTATQKVVRYLMPTGTSRLPIPWEETAKKLEVPIYFLQKTIVNQLLLRKPLHDIVLAERTGLRREKIRQIRLELANENNR